MLSTPSGYVVYCMFANRPYNTNRQFTPEPKRQAVQLEARRESNEGSGFLCNFFSITLINGKILLHGPILTLFQISKNWGEHGLRNVDEMQ